MTEKALRETYALPQAADMCNVITVTDARAGDSVRMKKSLPEYTSSRGHVHKLEGIGGRLN